ncbi:MAG: hypothetical protein JKY53_11660 [Flavobacteriales bacterium]|nr:hypothetical protein [Flavobacteriales bacterium]
MKKLILIVFLIVVSIDVKSQDTIKVKSILFSINLQNSLQGIINGDKNPNSWRHKTGWITTEVQILGRVTRGRRNIEWGGCGARGKLYERGDFFKKQTFHSYSVGHMVSFGYHPISKKKWSLEIYSGIKTYFTLYDGFSWFYYQKHRTPLEWGLHVGTFGANVIIKQNRRGKLIAGIGIIYSSYSIKAIRGGYTGGYLGNFSVGYFFP